MRGTRRFTLVPSLSVAAGSECGTGLSETAYFGFAIEKPEYNNFRGGPRMQAGMQLRRRGAACASLRESPRARPAWGGARLPSPDGERLPEMCRACNRGPPWKLR